jgi:hypothetical protein
MNPVYPIPECLPFGPGGDGNGQCAAGGGAGGDIEYHWLADGGGDAGGGRVYHWTGVGSCASCLPGGSSSVWMCSWGQQSPLPVPGPDVCYAAISASMPSSPCPTPGWPPDYVPPP